MITKRYTEKSIEKIQERVLRELGPEAIILTMREIKPKGFLRFFCSDKVEATVAIDKEINKEKKSAKNDFKQNLNALKSWMNESPPASAPDDSAEELFIASKTLLEKLLQASEVRKEFEEAEKEIAKESKVPGIVQFLISKGISRTIAQKIVSKMVRRFGVAEMPAENKLRTEMLNFLKKELSSAIKTSGPIILTKGETKICAFVGPTGVGKTTTVVKIAATYALELQKKVAILLIDGSKMRLYDQLTALSRPFNLEVMKIDNVNELQESIKSYSDYDLVLIDTSGRSPYQWQKVDELADVLSPVEGLETYLVLSASTKDVDALGAVRQFERLNINSLIFTKLDETIAYGLLVNMCYKTDKPISYLTNGQNIPADLLVANPDEIARSILVQHNTQEFDAIRHLANQ